MPRLTPEEIFLNDITSLIKNLLIENPNYKNGHYYKIGAIMPRDVIDDTKERATYILERIESISYLVTAFQSEE